jgi:hypothetical protein
MARKYDILICDDDLMSLPRKVCKTIKEAIDWIGCTKDALYKSQHIHGVMKAKGYIVELVSKEVIQ